MKVVKNIVIALAWVAVIALIVGLILFLSKFTNGFQESFKTFYVSYGDTDITSKKSKISINRNSEHRFDVKYVFGSTVHDGADKSYKVEVVPNSEYEDLIFTVNGVDYFFGKIENLSDVFEIECNDTYFILRTSKTVNLISVLQAKYPDETVEVNENFAKANNYYYTLRVSSYNGKTVYDIDFNFNVEINIDKDGVVF